MSIAMTLWQKVSHILGKTHGNLAVLYCSDGITTVFLTSCYSVSLPLISTEPVFNKDQPLLTHINSTHAGLNLQGWTSGGCPITDLMLDFRPKGTWAWQSLKANSTSQLFLSELREATWYELKMKACNSAGCGNQSSQFATTDYDGSK